MNRQTMSSEEKEPYFDGPLVTPPTGQLLFYPGGNPQSYGQMPNQPQPAAAPMQPAGPAFYNPNDYGAAAAVPNLWEVPVHQEHMQPQYNMNGSSGIQENATLPGTQAYFGGVDSTSSASSSQHTTPEHVRKPKLNENLYTPAPYQSQLYTPHASSLFTPQTDSGATVNSPLMYDPNAAQSGFSGSPEKSTLSAPIPSFGGSVQPTFAHPPTSGIFVPRPEVNNIGVQNYLNPVPHDPPPQTHIFTPNMGAPDLVQAQMPDDSLMNDAHFKTDNTSPVNPMDLHNGNTAYQQPTTDQSYMNMGYNHNYSGVSPPQNSTLGNFYEEEIPQVPVMAPSGQDYDILHSQGTWEEQNNIYSQELRPNENVAVVTNLPHVHDERQAAIGDEGPVVIDGQSGEGMADMLPQDDMPVMNQDGDLNQVPTVQVQQNLEDPAGNEPPSVPDLSNQEQTLLLQPDQDSVPETDLGLNDVQSLKNVEQPDTEGAVGGENQPQMLSLGYDSMINVPKHSEGQDNGYAYGNMVPVDKGNEDQSYGDNLAQTRVPEQELEIVQGNDTNDAEILSDDVQLEQPSESPIPADGLHPKQLILEPNLSEIPHHFASPNSAFESRIRSQSTGSNNSNASSQRSANNQPGRVNQNRQGGQLYPNPGPDVNQLQRQEAGPTSNPFSTDTMHSSHMADQDMSAPPPPPRTAIPDIVRPLPSGASDENLRTGATVPLSSNQSLHSQVVRTAYPPEPTISIPQSSGAVTTRPQPDLIQSPADGASAQLRMPSELVNSVLELKTNDPPPQSTPQEASVTSAPIAALVISDPYLSRSLHNPHRDVAAPSASVQEPVVPPTSNLQSAEQEQSPESSLAPSSTRTSDLHLRDTDDRRSDEPGRSGEESRNRDTSDRSRYGDDSRRDPRWDEDRRRDDEYRRRDYGRDDDRYGGRWDPRDDRDRHRDEKSYDDARRQDHDSRPGSRQGASHDSYYSRRYDDRGYGRDHDYRERDPYYYRERYYDDRYPDYDRRDPYYRYDDRRSDRYYDPHHRYPDSYHGHGRQYQDSYYYDSYYQDYRYHDRRRYDDDSRSVYSETSRAVDPALEREWHMKHGDTYDYSYYDSRYYDDSLADESTLPPYDEWQSLPSAPVRKTPARFGSAHTIVRFGPGGQLIKVLANNPADNQPTTVEIHSLELILQNTKEAEDLRSYTGPLISDQTHKNDVLQFASIKSSESMKSVDLMDRRSTSLIWDFLGMLVRQNGSVLGTDIAELLTKDYSGDFTLLQSPLEASRQRQLHPIARTATPNSISDEAAVGASPIPDQTDVKSTISSQSTEVSNTQDRNCNRFRELLLHGRRKDALEWAMKSGLWGHALLLASKTDSRTHAQVMLRFANSLPINDPLQTVYQLMSGRQPAAATCISEEGWGDWRPHLAMILSNPTSSASLDMRAVLTMGDTLSTRGLLHAAHFCYLMSSTPLGYYGRSSSKMVLLGGNHMLPFNEFASWDSIRRTEIYEYAISLGKQKSGSSSHSTTLPPFQLYKFIYACRLAEYGLIAQAFHYCEHVAQSVCRSPSLYSPVLVNQLLNVSDQLRYHDPQIHAGVSEPGSLHWLEKLRTINEQMQNGLITPRTFAPGSFLTTSNTPSVVSTSPTTDNDDIRFSAHTPDLDSEDIPDSKIPSDQIPPQLYSQTAPQVTTYSGASVPNSHQEVQPTLTIPDTALDQVPNQGYSQDPSQMSMQGGSYQMQGGFYQQQQPGFMQPSGQTYQQPQVPMGNFDQLANAANPLEPGANFQHHNSYGFNPEIPMSAGPMPEDTEQNDKVDDYYDYMANANKSHFGRSTSPRSRTVSQSSQRSRASTIKGYDRKTPTAMTNHTGQGRRSRTTSENSGGRRSRKTSGEKMKNKDKTDEEGVKKSGSWLFGWLTRRQSKQVHLPDDKDNTIIWDDAKQRWVDKNATEEDNAPPPPPPTDTAMQPAAATNTNLPLQPISQNQTQPAAPPGEPQLTANRFSLKNLGGGRSMYKNAFSTSSKPVTAPAPVDLPGFQNSSISKPTGFMIPNPVPTSQPVGDQDTAPTTTPMHPIDSSQAIQMFTPGNTPQGSSNDFTQPFNHGGNSAIPSMNSGPMAEQNPSSSGPGPTMFFNPSQLTAQPDLLSQPPLAGPGRGNALNRRARGRPGYPGRR